MAIDRTKYLDYDEYRRLRTTTENWANADLQRGARQGVVAWALVDTAMLTGLRVNELAKLRVGDFIAGRSSLLVHRTKRKRGAVTETLAICPKLVKHLRRFIAWKQTAGESTDPGAALVCGKRGPMTFSGMQKLWKVAVKRAGLPRELSIHAARHTMAVHLLSRTKNLRQVQKQLGHSSPVTTANMYADVQFDEMIAGTDGMYDRRKGS